MYICYYGLKENVQKKLLKPTMRQHQRQRRQQQQRQRKRPTTEMGITKKATEPPDCVLRAENKHTFRESTDTCSR